ncbi:PLP-dependent aminotransferase family protein [Sulfobacillus thermosulfidooxidans]|uniref:aminotransferase-like domain-containing protein n=1 Tax=Sulfobacillus thermosulfidooxidans TaxID=28034 RepID=UPI0002FBC0EB|nr:PLP-dependent aminotransferase family protein [Sulfobacillus thermosulfidooxidans]
MRAFQKVAEKIRLDIENGVWRIGDTLSSERQMAQQYQVSRSTIRRAWEELETMGYIKWDAFSPPQIINVPQWPTAIARSSLTQWNQAQTKPVSSFLSDLMSAAASQARFNFEIGMPDASLLPIFELESVIRELFTQRTREVFSYSPTAGIDRVREAIAEEFLGRRNLHLSPDHLLITSGSLQALDLLSSLWIRPGDIVITESPTFAGALQIFRAHGAQIIGIDVGTEGVNPAQMKDALSRHDTRLIYLQPYYQNPTSVSMSEATRQALLDLAIFYHVPIIEDDAYGFLAPGHSLPLRAYKGAEEHVIYINTFSKILAPGLRVGFIAGPPDLIYQLTQIKQLGDLHTGTVSQLLVEGWLRSGNIDQYIQAVRKVYAERIQTAKQLLPQLGFPIWGNPHNGFYVFAELPRSLSALSFHQYAAKRDVLFAPGLAFGTDDQFRHWIRLCVSTANPMAIHTGLARLSRLVKAYEDAPGSFGL